MGMRYRSCWGRREVTGYVSVSISRGRKCVLWTWVCAGPALDSPRL